ncbi:unnamed protein product [Strongylus vulgaris]|uniref:Uncharacterized protein n=1 Tax=Strongylus vulgaris TaxID=40348 RepID=A0A3P7JS21_STRVU|nr:unnamed protein product [Strongylus vulgaris]
MFGTGEAVKIIIVYFIDKALQRLFEVDEKKRCQEVRAYVAYAQSSQAGNINRQAQQGIIKSLEPALGYLAYLGIVLIVLAANINRQAQQGIIKSLEPALGYLAYLGIVLIILAFLFLFDFPFLDATSSKSITYFVFGLYHLTSYSTSFIEEEHEVW